MHYRLITWMSRTFICGTNGLTFKPQQSITSLHAFTQKSVCISTWVLTYIKPGGSIRIDLIYCESHINKLLADWTRLHLATDGWRCLTAFLFRFALKRMNNTVIAIDDNKRHTACDVLISPGHLLILVNCSCIMKPIVYSCCKTT